MSEFKFKNLQRVILPREATFGVAGVQGLIFAGFTELNGLPSYQVQYPSHLKRGANGLMETCVVTVSEIDLIAAQPPKMVTEEAALALAKKSLDDGRAAAFAEIEAEREARRRKRKPAGKAKPKSKRNR